MEISLDHGQSSFFLELNGFVVQGPFGEDTEGKKMGFRATLAYLETHLPHSLTVIWERDLGFLS